MQIFGGEWVTCFFIKKENFKFKFFISNTVNMVIFAGGKFRKNVSKTFHVGVIFMILLLFPS